MTLYWIRELPNWERTAFPIELVKKKQFSQPNKGKIL